MNIVTLPGLEPTHEELVAAGRRKLAATDYTCKNCGHSNRGKKTLRWVDERSAYVCYACGYTDGSLSRKAREELYGLKGGGHENA